MPKWLDVLLPTNGLFQHLETKVITTAVTDPDYSEDLPTAEEVEPMMIGEAEPIGEEGVPSEVLKAPHPHESTPVVRKRACARLTRLALESAVGRCYPSGREEAQHEREARKD